MAQSRKSGTERASWRERDGKEKTKCPYLSTKSCSLSLSLSERGGESFCQELLHARQIELRLTNNSILFFPTRRHESWTKEPRNPRQSQSPSHNPSTMSQQLAELKGTKLRSSAANDDVVEREFSHSLSLRLSILVRLLARSPPRRSINHVRKRSPPFMQ